jgi:hypothetical protein
MSTSSDTHLVHTLNRAIDFHHGEVQLFHYDYAPELPRKLAPKPSFHPLRSLAGHVVTCQQPHDHIWHQGLAMTFAELSGDNFWGGGTFTKDRGYVDLDDHGIQLHTGWRDIWQRDSHGGFVHELIWRSRDRVDWLQELRTVEVRALDAAAGYWALAFACTLTNVSGQTLEFGSPTTKGRPAAGYGSLFWRGPRDFTGCAVRLSTGVDSQGEAMGSAAEWLAFTGKHDGSPDVTTMVFADHPDNPRFPTKWFVRSTPYAAASFAFMFDEIFPLEPGRQLALKYTVIIADGERDDAAVTEPIAASRPT